MVPASLRGVWGAELGAWLPPAHTPHPGHIQTARSGEELRSMLEAGAECVAPGWGCRVATLLCKLCIVFNMYNGAFKRW